MTQRDLFEDLKDKVEDKFNDVKSELQEDAKALWGKPVIKFMVAGFLAVVLCMITFVLLG